MPSPRCAECKSTNIAWETKTFSGIAGVLVYCGACGAVISWAPKPEG